MLTTEDGEGMNGAHILAVLVLYERTPEESETFTSLRAILHHRPDLARGLNLLVYDNSPTEHNIPALPIATQYVSNTRNAGLARAYNTALQLADENNISWLLLLDQDTLLTEEYLAEIHSQTDAGDDRFEAIVPKLAEDGVVLSPHLAISFRHPKPVDVATYGISATHIHPYNSGAALRVKALQEMGGFPENFWLDYLDHATFRKLQTNGGRIFVMRAILEHKLSSNSVNISTDSAALARQKNILQAERSFYRGYGTRQEQFYYHIRLIRRSWKALLAGHFKLSLLLLQQM